MDTNQVVAALATVRHSVCGCVQTISIVDTEAPVQYVYCHKCKRLFEVKLAELELEYPTEQKG